MAYKEKTGGTRHSFAWPGFLVLLTKKNRHGALFRNLFIGGILLRYRHRVSTCQGQIVNNKTLHGHLMTEELR